MKNQIKTVTLAFLCASSIFSCKKDSVSNQIEPKLKNIKAKVTAFIPDLKITVFKQNGIATKDSMYYKIPVKIYERNVGTDSASAPDSIIVYQRKTYSGFNIDFKVSPVFHRHTILDPFKIFVTTGQVWVKKSNVNLLTGLKLIAKADGPNAIVESNETNNYSIVINAVLP